MRPGEIIAGDGSAPAARATRRATVRIRNDGRLPAYLGSHFPLAHASGSLAFERTGLEGARLDLPSGATARIGPGEEAELTVIWS